MVLNRLQKALINLHIGQRAPGLNCQNIFFFKCEHIIFLTLLIEIFVLNITMYHKCRLTYQKYKKKVKKCYYRRYLRMSWSNIEEWRKSLKIGTVVVSSILKYCAKFKKSFGIFYTCFYEHKN
jgi:hypothetical protein